MNIYQLFITIVKINFDLILFRLVIQKNLIDKCMYINLNIK